MAQLALLPCLLVVSLLVFSSAFKEQDFKKCQDASFCARNRGKTGTSFSLLPNSFTSEGATLKGELINTQNNAQFQFSLIGYDSFLRLVVDEIPSVDRYRVPDVVVPRLDRSQSSWTGVANNGKTLSAKLGDYEVVVTFQPFKMEILQNGVSAVTLNGRHMFNFEQRRQKQEGDPEGWWEESFNGHRDSKPKGPEAISLDISFPRTEFVYGIPEHATNLALKPTTGSGITSEPYRMYNLDVFQYLENSPFSLYGSIPFMLGHKQGQTTGVFWLNAAEMFIDVEKRKDGTHTHWIAESGIVDLFIMAASKPASVVNTFARITGTTAMPQMFAIGYHQCRWNYKDEADVKAVDGGFDQHIIPYDVIWLDIEHTNGKRYFTWDSGLFPTPEAMQNDVAARGRKMVTIVDPHVKRDSGYYIHSEAQKRDFYVKNRDNHEFDGWCWPGSSSYLDFTNPSVRSWWSSQFRTDAYKGSTPNLYIWNDMNEPSVFNGPEITMYKDNIHFQNREHRDVHNLYGYYYHMATAQGLIERGWEEKGPDGDRPFVLSRAFFAGTQRVGPIWTGDNAAEWSHLKVAVPMLLTLGITGLPFSGADVGGFFGNPDAELVTRWYQSGAFYPFFRGHAHLEAARREPWLFGEDTTMRIRDAIRLRYALLPYLYTLFRDANTTGAPIMRPLWYQFPDSKDVYTEEEEFLLGPAILVRPVLAAGASHVDALLPRASKWYDGITGAVMQKSTWLSGADQLHRIPVNMDRIPWFFRGGHVIARRDRPRRSTAAMANDPFTLVVALDDQQTAVGYLYLDDGRSFAFTKGAYLHRKFEFAANKLISTPHQEPGTPAGHLDTPLTIERIIILGLPTKSWKASWNGKALDIAPGPLNLAAAPQSTAAYIIRKPDLPVAKDWTVSLS